MEVLRPVSLSPATHSAPLSTDGVDISGWGLQMDSIWGPGAPLVQLSVWDFAGIAKQFLVSCILPGSLLFFNAGQEIYYSTHQFFLSERSLFLVIFNLVNLVESRVEYWCGSL